jgi:competence protein ComEC
MRRLIAGFVLWLAIGASGVAFGQANGKLQIHHMDVGQGDGAVLISPGGQVVLFDVGEDLKKKSCTKPVAYLDQLGVKKVDALFVSHYHFDHIGCIPAVLQQFPLKGPAYDRGASYSSSTFDAYKKAIGTNRKTASVGDTFVFDKSTANPITVTVVAVNGNSQTSETSTTNENDLSLAVLVSFGQFREEIGGDLSGENKGDYKDIETGVAPEVGHVDVYKVHHHCSSYSSNKTWLDAITPTVGIISTGDGNGYHHPAADCIDRLHKIQSLKKMYWTEHGNGGAPTTGDVVVGNVVVDVPEGGATYTVTGGTSPADSYQTATVAIGPTPPSPAVTGVKYAWSSKSKVYHLANCSFVDSIAPGNLQKGDTPPTGKTLHKGCPTTAH